MASSRPLRATEPVHRGRSRQVLTSSQSGTSLDKADYCSTALQPYLIENIMETGEEIGRGAYGVVYKIRRWGTVCAAKKLHDLPLQVQLQNSSIAGNSTYGEDGGAGGSSSSHAPDSSPVSGIVKSSKRITGGSLHGRSQGSKFNSANPLSKRADILAKFEKECNLLSNLRHPYIVQFLGVYIEKLSGTPVIVMEYLPNSLSNLVKAKPTIPRYLQISILYNVALGLAFLHGHTPPIIHRDLTANNVLLTSNMVAKIADLGVARILDLTPKRVMQLTQAPGTAAYMPPEALAQNPSYNTKMDVFSFGVLSLHLVSQVWPIPTEAVKVLPHNKLIPISEVDRRRSQFDLMGSDHCLYQLTVKCLQNDASQRPEIAKVGFTLETLQTKFPLPSTSYLDLLQVLENNRNQLEAKGMQLATNKEQLHKYSIRIENREGEIADLKRTIQSLEKQAMTQIKSQFLDAEEVFNAHQQKTVNGNSSKSPSESPTSPSPCPSPSSPSSSPTFLVPSQSSFLWRRDADLPIGTFGSKGVFLDDKLYLGGGDCKEMNSERVVYEYDINGIVRKWTALPAAPVVYFAMATVNQLLVLVGGMDMGKKVATNQLTNWDKELQRWSAVLPPMRCARQDCTVVTYNKWLLVAGGVNYKKPIYNVELLDLNTVQWMTTHPLPKPSVGMTSCVVKNTWYLLGGTNFTEPVKGETGPKEYVFSLTLDENIATNKWTQIADTPLYCCTAVPFGDHLMAVGGTDSLTSRTYSGSMFLYSPSAEKWVYVGNMPSARSQATCVVLSNDRLAVMGGQERGSKFGRLAEVLHC